MDDKIRIALVDDHPLFREGVAHTLRSEPDIEVVGQGESLAEAIRLVGELTPDLILLDINIPGGGIQAAQAIADAYPATVIVMLTAASDDDDLVAALKAGARIYPQGSCRPRIGQDYPFCSGRRGLCDAVFSSQPALRDGWRGTSAPGCTGSIGRANGARASDPGALDHRAEQQGDWGAPVFERKDDQALCNQPSA